MESHFLLFPDVPGNGRLYPLLNETRPNPYLEETGMKGLSATKSRFYLFLFSIFFLSAFLNVPNSRAAAGTKNAANQSPAHLTAADVTAFVDDYVAGQMAAAHAPGLVVTVVSRGEVLFSKGYGLADLESGRPMTANTNLRAGSVSKPLTSLAVLQLAANGQIALDAPVSDYLTSLALEDAYGPAGTVAQLLTLKGGYAGHGYPDAFPNPGGLAAARGVPARSFAAACAAAGESTQL